MAQESSCRPKRTHNRVHARARPSRCCSVARTHRTLSFLRLAHRRFFLLPLVCSFISISSFPLCFPGSPAKQTMTCQLMRRCTTATLATLGSSSARLCRPRRKRSTTTPACCRASCWMARAFQGALSFAWSLQTCLGVVFAQYSWVFVELVAALLFSVLFFLCVCL